MIRLRTKVGNGRVFTLYFMGKWVTLINDGTRASSVDADNLMMAGANHLAAATKLKEIMDDRGRFAEQLLHRERYSGSLSSGVSDGSDGANREGSHRDGGSERDQNLPPNSSSEENQNTSELGSQNAELNDGQERV